MRPDRIVVIAPLLDDDGCFSQAVEDFTIEAFVPQLAVERLTKAVLPRASGFNVERPGAKRCEPVAYDLRRHLRTVVRTDVFRHTTFEHHIGHRLDDAEAVYTTGHLDRQTFPGELVDQCHQPELVAIVGLRFDKVVAPDMIAMLRPQTDATAIVEPEPTAWLLSSWYF